MFIDQLFEPDPIKRNFVPLQGRQKGLNAMIHVFELVSRHDASQTFKPNLGTSNHHN